MKERKEKKVQLHFYNDFGYLTKAYRTPDIHTQKESLGYAIIRAGTKDGNPAIRISEYVDPDPEHHAHIQIRVPKTEGDIEPILEINFLKNYPKSFEIYQERIEKRIRNVLLRKVTRK